MSADIRQLAVLTYAHGFTHWVYQEAPAKALAPGFFDPVADLLTVSDLITITGVREFGYHGVLDFEKSEGQEFIVDAAIETDFTDAVASDDINAPVDYGAVGALIAATISGTRFDLIESLADRICRDIAAVLRAECGEDFAFMLQAKPGCYVFMGNGQGAGIPGCMLHNPGYDFNDEALPVGSSYWVKLVEHCLAAPTR